MARTPGAIIGGHGTSVKGLSELIARINRIGPGIRARLEQAIDASADDLVKEISAIAPVSDLDPHPGALKGSVHKEAGRHELSRLVVVDAEDKNGHGYAPHVEFGHKTKSGEHVAAEPFFYPSVRRSKKTVRGRVSRAMSKAIKDVYG